MISREGLSGQHFHHPSSNWQVPLISLLDFEQVAVTATGTPLGIMGVIEGTTTATGTNTITGIHTVTSIIIGRITEATVTGDDTTVAATVISKTGLRRCSLEQRETFGSASMAANPGLS